MKVSEDFRLCERCHHPIGINEDCPFHAVPAGLPPLADTNLSHFTSLKHTTHTPKAGRVGRHPSQHSSPSGDLASFLPEDGAGVKESPAPEDSSLPARVENKIKRKSQLIPGGRGSAGTSAPTEASVVLAEAQGMELWTNRRIHILQALALGTLAFVEAGRLLNQARENADWAKLSTEGTWEQYLDDLGIHKTKASRLMTVARFVEKHGFTEEFVRLAGETRLYLAHLALKRGAMESQDLERLAEKGCYELRQALGYKEDDRPFAYICGNCGEELEQIQCPRCHEGKLKRKKIALAKQEGE